MRNPFGVLLGAGRQVVTGEDALITQGIEKPLVNERRWQIRPDLLLRPDDALARRLAIFQRDAAARARANDEDGHFGAAAAGDDDQVVSEDRRGRGDLRAAS